MLKTENLKYIYEDGTIALQNINIDLNKGNRIAIVGSNGAGKSTLFLNMTGVLKPKAGYVYYNKKKLKYKKSDLYEYRKKVGIVFQDPDKQIFYSNVYDDVAFALRNLEIDEEIIKEKVDRVLKKVGAYDFKDKPVHFLSHGQKKRVAIAGILAMENELILFDEPTAGLDPEMTQSIVDILLDLSKEGKKLVISSHDMDLIYEVCDYIYVLHHGEIIAEGKTAEIFIKDNILKKAGLKEPWLVKVHKNMNLPLFENEQILFKYWSEHYENSSNRR